MGKYVNEKMSILSIQHLTQHKFKKCRPKWLSFNGGRLELDGYNNHLNVAIEYNGKQHYTYIPFFHRTPDALNNQIRRDKAKIQLCKLNNVKLIYKPLKRQKHLIIKKLLVNLLKWAT